MPRERRNIADHVFTGNDRLFVDTCVWFAVYGPLTTRQARQAGYAPRLTAAYGSAAQLFTDALVVGELTNLWLRLAHGQSACADQGIEFKDFRQSTEYGLAAEELRTTLQDSVLARCSWCKHALSKQDVHEALAALPRGQRDFTDLLLVRLCQRNNLVLVTDDADFANADVPILTSNARLLGAAGL
jgi:predicted nucleic acid-binding protein